MKNTHWKIKEKLFLFVMLFCAGAMMAQVTPADIAVQNGQFPYVKLSEIPDNWDDGDWGPGLITPNVPQATNGSNSNQNLMALTFFTDRTTFEGAACNIVSEPFNGPGQGQFIACNEPINSTSANCYGVGGVIPGFSLTAEGASGNSAPHFVAGGAGFQGLPSAAILTNFFTAHMRMTFPNDDVYSVGWDFYEIFFNLPNYDIDIYTTGNVLLGTGNIANSGFFGVTSDDVITRIDFYATPQGAFSVECIDNLTMGTACGGGGGGGGCNATACVQITCPPDATIDCIDNLVLDPLDAVAIGTCSPIVGQWITNPIISGVPGCPGTTYTYSYRAVDADGNLGCCDRVITIDNLPPTVTVPAGGFVDCYEDIQVDVSDAVVTGACADYNLYLTAPEIVGAVGCPGTTYTFTYRLVEACGRVVEATRTFTENANAAPVIDAPANTTCTCIGGITPNPNNATVTTSCGVGYSVVVTGPAQSGAMNCPNTTYTYTYTVTDDCGRVAQDQQVFTIANGFPTFEDCPGDNWLHLNCEDYGGEGGAIDVIEAWISSVTAYDACGQQLTVLNDFNSNNINTCINNGINEVEFRTTDGCGRTSFCYGTFVIVDTEAPVFTEEAQDQWSVCSFNTQASLDAWVANRGGAQAVDGCQGNTVNWTTSPGNPQWNMGNCGSLEVTFIATDNCGNKSSTTGTFNVLDPMAPNLFKQPEDMTVDCASNWEDAFDDWLADNGGAMASDMCGEVNWTTDPPNPELSDDCGNTGSVTVIFIADDGCGNSVESDPATFAVVDDTPPVFTFVPADMTIECAGTPVFGTPIATDDCSGVTITFEDTEEGTPCEMIFTRTWTATDDCGNSATASQTITIIDDEAPEFTFVPADMTIDCTEDPVFGTPTAEDNCGNVTITQVDMQGLSVTGTFSGDQENPPSGSSGTGTVTGGYDSATGMLFLKVVYSGLSANATAAHIHNAPAGSNGGVIVNLAPLGFEAGSTSGSFIASTALSASDGAELEAGNLYINIHSSFAPPGEIRAQLHVNTDCNDMTFKRTWTATDDCGNSATASQVITAIDDTAPVFTSVPADMTIDCTEDPVFGTPEATDDCNGVTITSEDTESGDSCEMIYTRTWTATDGCGNSSSASQTITAIDNTPPVFTYVPPVPDIDCMVPPFDWEEPIAEDDCSGVTLTFVEEPPNGSLCDQGAAFVRAYTATDACGNSSTVDVIIWVNADAGPPEFTFVPDDLTFYCVNGDTPDDIPDATAVDDCDPDVMITFEDEYNTDPDDCGNDYGYDVERTWTATDHCGNTTTVTSFFWFKGPLSSPPGGGSGFDSGNNDGRNGIVELSSLFELNPNPTSGNLNVTFGSVVEQKATIRIFNILGTEVLNQLEPAVKGRNNTVLSVEHLIPGTYLISIELEDSIVTKKFIRR